MSNLSNQEMELMKLDEASFANFCRGYLLIEIGKGNFRTAVDEILTWQRMRHNRPVKKKKHVGWRR